MNGYTGHEIPQHDPEQAPAPQLSSIESFAFQASEPSVRVTSEPRLKIAEQELGQFVMYSVIWYAERGFGFLQEGDQNIAFVHAKNVWDSLTPFKRKLARNEHPGSVLYVKEKIPPAEGQKKPDISEAYTEAAIAQLRGSKEQLEQAVNRQHAFQAEKAQRSQQLAEQFTSLEALPPSLQVILTEGRVVPAHLTLAEVSQPEAEGHVRLSEEDPQYNYDESGTPLVTRKIQLTQVIDSQESSVTLTAVVKGWAGFAIPKQPIIRHQNGKTLAAFDFTANVTRRGEKHEILPAYIPVTTTTATPRVDGVRLVQQLEADTPIGLYRANKTIYRRPTVSELGPFHITPGELDPLAGIEVDSISREIIQLDSAFIAEAVARFNNEGMTSGEVLPIITDARLRQEVARTYSPGGNSALWFNKGYDPEWKKVQQATLSLTIPGLPQSSQPTKLDERDDYRLTRWGTTDPEFIKMRALNLIKPTYEQYTQVVAAISPVSRQALDQQPTPEYRQLTQAITYFEDVLRTINEFVDDNIRLETDLLAIPDTVTLPDHVQTGKTILFASSDTWKPDAFSHALKSSYPLSMTQQEAHDIGIPEVSRVFKVVRRSDLRDIPSSAIPVEKCGVIWEPILFEPLATRPTFVERRYKQGENPFQTLDQLVNQVPELSTLRPPVSDTFIYMANALDITKHVTVNTVDTTRTHFIPARNRRDNNDDGYDVTGGVSTVVETTTTPSSYYARLSGSKWDDLTRQMTKLGIITEDDSGFIANVLAPIPEKISTIRYIADSLNTYAQDQLAYDLSDEQVTALKAIVFYLNSITDSELAAYYRHLLAPSVEEAKHFVTKARVLLDKTSRYHQLPEIIEQRRRLQKALDTYQVDIEALEQYRRTANTLLALEKTGVRFSLAITPKESEKVTTTHRFLISPDGQQLVKDKVIDAFRSKPEAHIFNRVDSNVLELELVFREYTNDGPQLRLRLCVRSGELTEPQKNSIITLIINMLSEIEVPRQNGNPGEKVLANTVLPIYGSDKNALADALSPDFDKISPTTDTAEIDILVEEKEWYVPTDSRLYQSRNDIIFQPDY